MLVGAFFVSVLGNYDFGAALFEFSTALSGTGLSIGITSSANLAVLWILNVGMFIGRLEILVVFYAISRMVRDLLRKETI